MPGFLAKRIGPFPVWAWGLIVAGGIVAAYFVPKLFGGTRTPDQTSPDQGTTNAANGGNTDANGLPAGNPPPSSVPPTPVTDQGQLSDSAQLADIQAQLQQLLLYQQNQIGPGGLSSVPPVPAPGNQPPVSVPPVDGLNQQISPPPQNGKTIHTVPPAPAHPKQIPAPTSTSPTGRS
jgi:hypothetical protein